MARKKEAVVVEDGEEQPKKKGKLKFGLLVVVIAAAGAYLTGIFPPASADEGEGEAAEEVIEDGEVVPIPELVLNLADEQLHYLRVGVALILEKGTSKGSIEKELPVASDVAVEVLSAKTFHQLREPGAKEAVKAELTERVRAAYEEAYGKAKVSRVIFTSFVMQ